VDVGLELAGRQLPQCLIEVVEGGELVLDVELLGELVKRRLVDVLGPVVEPQRAGLGLQP
jgi:hypothetical protein